MADSLRDQLIAAGFEAPKKPASKPAKKHQNSGQNSGRNNSQNKRKDNGKKRQSSASSKKSVLKNSAPNQNKIQNNANDKALAEAAERKKLKAQIKDLIDNNKIENWKGEIAYRYTVEKRIRELYVNEAAQKQLTAREASITRLNGDTFLVPIAIATEIIKINPQWSVFNATDSEDKPAEDDGYSEFQVPDDLQW